jgi:hypothetical protein
MARPPVVYNLARAVPQRLGCPGGRSSRKWGTAYFIGKPPPSESVSPNGRGLIQGGVHQSHPTLACVGLARLKQTAVSHLAVNRCWGRSPSERRGTVGLTDPRDSREGERKDGGWSPAGEEGGD